MVWGVAFGYLLGILLALAALLIALINILAFFGLRLPPRVSRNDFFEDTFGPLLVASIVSLVSLFVAAVLDGPGTPSATAPDWLSDAAALALLVDAGILGLFLAAIAILAIFALIFVLPVELWRELSQAVRERRIASSIGLFFGAAVWTLFLTFIVVITVIALPSLEIPFLDQILSAATSFLAFVSTAARGFLIVVLDAALLIAALAAALAVSYLARLFVEILLLRRPRPATMRRWFEAPWNSADEQDSQSSRPTVLENVARFVSTVVAVAAIAATGGDGERPIFRGTERRAREIATQRQTFLRREVREYRRTPPTQEVLEIPPAFAGSYDLRGLSRKSANARVVELLYQLSDEQSMLFGRLMDAIACYIRSRTRSDGDSRGLNAELVLRKLRWWEKWPGEYAWVALIRTANADEVVRFFEPLRDWLGMGVRIAPPVGWRPQRQCAYSTERGTVAGYLRTGTPSISYALTCAHVLPDNCPQSHITRSRQDPDNQPDAALLHFHPCVRPFSGGAKVNFVHKRGLQQLLLSKAMVHRVGGYSRRVSGFVKFRKAAYVVDGAVEEFPACVVQTARFRYMSGLLPLPFFRRRFSTGGDSGSWVMTQATASRPPAWLGMIAAGGDGDDKMESYVIHASALLQYFRRELSAERPFTPYRTEED